MTSCYIVDKSKSGTKKLAGLIGQNPELVLINTHTDLQQALKELDQVMILPHILFVALDNSNKYDIFLKYTIHKKTALVIVGSSDRFYKDAFILGATAYLARRVMEEEFNYAIAACKDKLLCQLEKQIPIDNSILVLTGPSSGARIFYHNLLYVENSKKKTLWHLAYQEPLKSPLSDIEVIAAKFRPNILVHISECRIVNLDHIVATQDGKILLSSGEEMDISPDYKETFFELMAQRTRILTIPLPKRSRLRPPHYFMKKPR